MADVSSSSSSTSSSSSESLGNFSSSTSSSSSSSSEMFHGNRTLPFTFEVDTSNAVWCLEFVSQDVYAGTGPNGILLKSRDRHFWEEVYRVDDSHIKSMKYSNGKLYVGTGPEGKIYILDFEEDTITLSQNVGGTVSKFCYYNGGLYMGGGNPLGIYKYNARTDNWDMFYRIWAGEVNDMLVFDSKMYVFTDKPNYVSYDGNSWTLQAKYINRNVYSLRKLKVG